MCAWFSVACKDGLLWFARSEESRIKMKVRFARGVADDCIVFDEGRL